MAPRNLQKNFIGYKNPIPRPKNFGGAFDTAVKKNRKTKAGADTK
jgi:hypothetical protein